MNKSKRAGLFSTLFMGLGQIVVNKEYLKGGIFAIIELLLLTTIGYFYRSIYGLVTLGTVTGFSGEYAKYNDHSIFLMIEGWIAIVLLAFVLIVYALNIADAVATTKRLEAGFARETLREYTRRVSLKAFPYMMSMPALLGAAFFILMPILFTIGLGFTNYSSPDHIPPANLVDWVGLQNLKDIIRLPLWNQTFIGVFTWTVIWAVSVTFLNFALGLLVAILVNDKSVKNKAVWRTIYFLPYGIPALISLMIFRNLFNGQFGPINLTLKDIGLLDPYFGIIKENIGWLSDPFIARFTVVGVSIWLGFPYFMALLTGIMTSISQTLYEAANIDGATKFQQFRHITLPMVVNATTPLLVMTFAYNFNNFNGVFFLTEGGPMGKYDSGSFAGSTDILITWIFKLVFNNQRYAIASLMSLLIFIIVGSFSIWNFSRTKAFKDI